MLTFSQIKTKSMKVLSTILFLFCFSFSYAQATWERVNSSYTNINGDIEVYAADKYFIVNNRTECYSKGSINCHRKSDNTLLWSYQPQVNGFVNIRDIFLDGDQLYYAGIELGVDDVSGDGLGSFLGLMDLDGNLINEKIVGSTDAFNAQLEVIDDKVYASFNKELMLLDKSFNVLMAYETPNTITDFAVASSGNVVISNNNFSIL